MSYGAPNSDIARYNQIDRSILTTRALEAVHANGRVPEYRQDGFGRFRVKAHTCTHIPLSDHRPRTSPHNDRTADRWASIDRAMKAGAAGAAKTAAAAFQAAAADGGSGSKATKQRERRLHDALLELRLSLVAATPRPSPAAAAAAAAAPSLSVPRSVIDAVVRTCLLGESLVVADAGAAAPVPPSAPVRVLAYQVKRTHFQPSDDKHDRFNQPCGR